MCPGRNIAKLEVLLTVATLLATFDMEFLRWLNADGSESSRGPIDSDSRVGSGATAPDREMEIRLKRR
jgi:hypothetical protein